MAKSRLYGWNGELPAKPVSGQKQIVLAGIKARPDELKTGKEWADEIGGQLATRQDPYRVVLYYLLELKGEGCIRTAEREIEATTLTDTGKHAVVVKTDSAVEERLGGEVAATGNEIRDEADDEGNQPDGEDDDLEGDLDGEGDEDDPDGDDANA